MERRPHLQVNPYEINRKKTRWDNYDYSRSGIYYVTFCTYDRICYLGEIIDGEMKYSNQGSIAEAFLSVLSVFNAKVEVLNYVIMPDHIHALILIHNEEADQRWFDHRNEYEEGGGHIHQKDSLSSIVGNYKASITRCCNRQHLNIKWQKGFFDRVVRNNEEMTAINRYINNNPGNWETDRLINPMGWPF